MEKVYTSSDHSFQLLSQMSDLWRGNKYCDAVLNLQDERFQLHKVVLMAACPNILRCLAHTEENNIFEFYLPEDIEKSAVRLTVNYLYVGSVQLNMENVYGIEKLAKQLRLSTLSQFCHDFISLLELETFHQSLLQPVIDQENIPKQESTQVENIVESKAVDELNSTTNATLSKINDRAYSISLPQSTDGFEQLPLASKPIKTELDASIGLTQEETISATQGKTITIEPLSNILQISKGDNSMTTTLAASLCKSYGSTTLDQQSVSDSSRLESHPVSHQTDSMGILDPLLNSSQISTISSLTPLPSKVACTPSTSQSHSEEGDYIGLIMTAEDEDFEDSDNEWVPQGDESSDSDYCPASSLDRLTKTKRKMPTKGPKAKRSKIDAPFTATEKTEGCDKVQEHISGKHTISLQKDRVVIVSSGDDLGKVVHKKDQETAAEENRCISKQSDQVSTSIDNITRDNIKKILNLLRVINGQKLEEILRLLHSLHEYRVFNSTLMEGIVQDIQAPDTDGKPAFLVQPDENTMQEKKTTELPIEQIQFQPSHDSPCTSALPELLVEIQPTKPSWHVMNNISSPSHPAGAPRHKRPINLKCNKGALVEISSHVDINSSVPADTEIRIKGHLLREAQSNAISLGNFAWWIAQKIFREDEMTGRNYHGNKGKLPLSPRRIHAIEHAVIDMCGPHMDNIREAANAINTGIRNRAHRKADKIVKKRLPFI